MLKGCQKRIIHITNTGSRFFEEAYFVMKSGGTAVPTGDIIKEAVRIAEDSLKNEKKRSKARIKNTLKLFFAGASVVSLIFGFVMLFFTVSS